MNTTNENRVQKAEQVGWPLEGKPYNPLWGQPADKPTGTEIPYSKKDGWECNDAKKPR